MVKSGGIMEFKINVVKNVLVMVGFLEENEDT